MKVNDWHSRFGAKRRAIDRALLAECERAIGLEESAGLHTAKTSQRPSAAVSEAILGPRSSPRLWTAKVH